MSSRIKLGRSWCARVNAALPLVAVNTRTPSARSVVSSRNSLEYAYHIGVVVHNEHGAGLQRGQGTQGGRRRRNGRARANRSWGQLEALPFGGGEDLQRALAGSDSGAREFAQPIDGLVMPGRVMVEERQLFRPRQHGIVDDTLHRRMPPSRFGGKLVQGVLRVVDDEIRTLEEPDVPPVSVVDRYGARWGLAW